MNQSVLPSGLLSLWLLLHAWWWFMMVLYTCRVTCCEWLTGRIGHTWRTIYCEWLTDIIVYTCRMGGCEWCVDIFGHLDYWYEYLKESYHTCSKQWKTIVLFFNADYQWNCAWDSTMPLFVCLNETPLFVLINMAIKRFILSIWLDRNYKV